MSAISFGLFQTISRKAGMNVNAFFHTFFLMMISTLFMIISTIILEDIKHITLNLTLQGIFYFAVAGMIHFVLGWTLLTISQNRIGASRTSALVGTAPFFATLIGYLFFQEVLSFLTIIGIILVVIGIYIVTNNKD
jgi:drug/metabolite transporter (DMT)-like permease